MLRDLEGQLPRLVSILSGLRLHNRIYVFFSWNIRSITIYIYTQESKIQKKDIQRSYVHSIGNFACVFK